MTAISQQQPRGSESSRMTLTMLREAVNPELWTQHRLPSRRLLHIFRLQKPREFNTKRTVLKELLEDVVQHKVSHSSVSEKAYRQWQPSRQQHPSHNAFTLKEPKDKGRRGAGSTGDLRIYFPTWTAITGAESVWGNSFGTLESTEGLQLPGEDLAGKLQLILVSFSQTAAPAPPATGQAAVHGSWSSLHAACRSPGGQRGPRPPNTRALQLMGDCCF